MQQDTSLGVATGLGILGMAVALVAFALEQSEVRLPTWSLIVLWWAAISLFVSGLLICFSGTISRRVSKFNHWRMVLASALVAIPATAGIWYFLLFNPSFVRNGGFEEKLAAWTFFAPDKDSQSIGEWDVDVSCEGRASFRVSHTQHSARPHLWLYQRVDGLDRNTNYTVVFWVKSEQSNPGSFLSADPLWAERKDLYLGGYQWMKHVKVFNTGGRDFFELRLVTQPQSKIWIDGVALYRGDRERMRLGRDRCPD